MSGLFGARDEYEEIDSWDGRNLSGKWVYGCAKNRTCIKISL